MTPKSRDHTVSFLEDKNSAIILQVKTTPYIFIFIHSIFKKSPISFDEWQEVQETAIVVSVPSCLK